MASVSWPTGRAARDRVRRYVRTLDRRDWSFLLAQVLVGGYVYLADLGSYTLAGWDEGVYATAAYHAVADGHWLVPHTYWIANTHDVSLQPFLHKPPLVVWLQALSMTVFGTNVFAARLPSALAAIGTGVVVYLVARHRLSRFAGFVGAVAWYTTPGVFAVTNGGRFAATDAVFVFFGSAFVVLAWRVAAEDRTDLLVPTCVVAALTVLSKGFAAGIFLLVVAPLFLVRPHLLVSRQMKRGVGAFALVTLPWHLLVLWRYGWTFVDQALVQQVLGRASGSVGVSTGGAVFGFMRYPYLRHFPSLFDPWAYWLLPAVVGLATLSHRRGSREDLRAVVFLAYWAAAVVGFFSLFGNHQWYVMPAYVPCALLVGWLFHEVAEWEASALAAAVVGVAGLLLFSPRFADFSPLAAAHLRGLHGGVWTNVVGGRDALWLLFALLLALVVVHLVRAGRLRLPAHERTVAVAPVVVGLLLVTSFVTPPASTGVLLHNQHELGTAVREASPSDETVYIQTRVPDATNLFPFEFYSRRAAASASRYDLYTDDEIRFAVVSQATLETLRRPHRVLAARKIQSGYGPKPLAAVEFTAPFDEYRPALASDAPAGNRLTNPSFTDGLAGWWTPGPDTGTVVRHEQVGGRLAAVLQSPEKGEPLPLAQRVAVQPGESYRLDVDAADPVSVAVAWYDGAKRPENLVDRRSYRASDLPLTLPAKGTQVAIRLRPVGSQAVVFSTSVERVLDPNDPVALGSNVLRNGDFERGLAEWWSNPDATGTQVSASSGAAVLRTPPGERRLPLAQRVVVDPDERYLVDVDASDYADVALVWFDNGSRENVLAREVIRAGETPVVVDARTHLVAVRVVPAARQVTVESVSVHRATTWGEWRERRDDED